MKNINDKEIDNVIYEGYKILDTREVTSDDVIKCLNSLSISEKITIMSNLHEILLNYKENNEIFMKALLKDMLTK